MSTTPMLENDRNTCCPQIADTKPYETSTLTGRAIYYILGVSSLIGLGYSIDALWPSKRADGSLIEIPNIKYLAVVLASFYVIGLARTLFLGRSPTVHKIGPDLERFYTFCIFSTVYVISLIFASEAGTVFTICVTACTIAIHQLSDPIEEFNVGKCLFVITWSGLIAFCSNKDGSRCFALIFAGFLAVFIGVHLVPAIRDMETAEFCPGVYESSRSKQ